MNLFRTGKMRFLYLLALVQLVGGPLVLLQVTVFCKLALHEAPRVGMVKATVGAWNSDEFHAVAAHADVAKNDSSKKVPPTDEPKQKMEKSKLPVIPWECGQMDAAAIAVHCKIVDRARIWTPAWPQAPPGPPPRLG